MLIAPNPEERLTAPLLRIATPAARIAEVEGDVVPMSRVEPVPVVLRIPFVIKIPWEEVLPVAVVEAVIPMSPPVDAVFPLLVKKPWLPDPVPPMIEWIAVRFPVVEKSAALLIP